MENEKKKRLFVLKIPEIGEVWVTKKFFDEYIKMRRREWKNDYNEGRCLIFSEKTGQFIRCRGKCSECFESRKGDPLSYEQLLEEGIDPSYMGNEVTDYINIEEVKNTVMWAFEHLEPFDSIVIKKYFYESKSLNEIAQELGTSKSTVGRHLETAKASVKSFLIKVYGSEEAAIYALA